MQLTEERFKQDLPDKPSELLLLAMADLKAIEDAGEVDIDMDSWAARAQDQCSVCMAGAVLKQRCLSPDDFKLLMSGRISYPVNGEIRYSVIPYDGDPAFTESDWFVLSLYRAPIPKPLIKKLAAINWLRCGEIEEAFADLGLEQAPEALLVDVEELTQSRDYFGQYDGDAVGFFEDMRSLVALLKKYGF